MKIYLKFIKAYLNFLSVVAPKYGGKIAVNMFQKVRIKKIKEKELDFYNKSIHFRVKRVGEEDLHCYEFGSKNKKVVFLIHGWDSNAGSLSRFAEELVKKNYRVISLDLPAHTNTKARHTNLFECSEAFKTLILHVNPKQPFDIISHSFGSSVAAYALANSISYEVNKIVYLSANNNVESIFRHYQKMIGFNDIIYKEVGFWVKKIIKDDLSEMIIADKLRQASFDELLIIHDKYDKVIPHNNAQEIYDAIKNVQLVTFEKIGHYRMLWNEDVIKETIEFITK